MDIITTHIRVFTNLCDGSVRTPAAYEEQASKTVESLVVGVWNHLLLWSLLIKPQLPLLLVMTYLKDNVNSSDTGIKIKKKTLLPPITTYLDRRGCEKNKLLHLAGKHI